MRRVIAIILLVCGSVTGSAGAQATKPATRPQLTQAEIAVRDTKMRATLNAISDLSRGFKLLRERFAETIRM